MGLAERRSIKQFQDTRFATLKREIDDDAGGAIEVSVNWESLAKEGYAHLVAKHRS